MAVLEKLVKATDNVRPKYRALQKGKQDDEKVLSDMFKPVVSPLSKLWSALSLQSLRRQIGSLKWISWRACASH